MGGAIALSVDAGLKQDEKVQTVSLRFLSKELEEQYQDYRYELARHSLSGRWGALAITSLVVCLHQLMQQLTSST